VANETPGLGSGESPHGGLELTLFLEEVHQVQVTVDGPLSLVKHGSVASRAARENSLNARLDVKATQVDKSA